MSPAAVRQASAPCPASPGSPAAPPPLRRDAARNRERLLAAAARVFAEHGLSATVDDVARTAGLGMGTLYRRFPTKEDLVSELVRELLLRFLALAEDAAAEPAGVGLEVFLRGASALQAEQCGCLPRLWTEAAAREPIAAIRDRTAELLSDAQRHGRVRDEITVTDISVILWSLRGIIETTRGGSGAASAWERHLELLVAGLRPASGGALVHPALTPAALDEILTASG